MALTFGLGDESDLIGALSVPRSVAPRNGGGAAAAFWARPVSFSRDVLDRAMTSPRNRKSTFADGVFRRAAMSVDEKETRQKFGRIADIAGLTTDERAALFGETRELSRVILALEILDAAIDIFHEPDAAFGWLRDENFAEPFNGCAPLQLMAANGRLGVEISLLYLRARLRLALCGG